jgi:hypothetical protein
VQAPFIRTVPASERFRAESGISTSKKVRDRRSETAAILFIFEHWRQTNRTFSRSSHSDEQARRFVVSSSKAMIGLPDEENLKPGSNGMRHNQLAS